MSITNISNIKNKIICFLIVALSLIFFAFNFPKSPVHKKIMFLVHTETLGGKGVYDIYKEMKKIGHDVKIVAIPYFYFGKLLTDIDLEFTSKFEQNDVVYPCGKQAPYTECSSIANYKPDYIFTQNPYDSFDGSVLAPNFTIKSLHRLAKTMLIEYAVRLFDVHSVNNKNLSAIIDTVFVDSEVAKDTYVKYYNFSRKNVVVSGYQPYKMIRDLKLNAPKIPQKTILWLPRWVLSFEERELYEGGSTFLNYYHFFYNYALNNPNTRLIIRPHALLFSTAVERNHLSQNDLDEIFMKFRLLKNVTISMHKTHPLINDIMASDIVISDESSALAEVVVADKPIIYLSNGWNNEFNSNKLSQEFKKCVYLAYSPNHIIKFINHIQKNHYEAFNEMPQQGRLAKIKKLISSKNCDRDNFKANLDPVENPAKFIAEYLLYN